MEIATYNSKNNNERNYGIDLLRILAVFYVIVLHTYGQGGILKNIVEGTSQYNFSWFIEIFTYCAVDIFALITGYVNYSDQKKKINYSKYINIWFQVVFYGVLITLVFNFMHPEIVTKMDLLQMFFPVTNGLYWYFTAYTALFVIMPLLNNGISSFTKETLKKILIILFVLFSVFATITNRFNLSGGYSFIWLVIVYIIGAIIKKCDIGKNIKPYQALIGILLCCIITWYWKIYGDVFYIFNIKVNKDFLVSYISPTVLLSAILYIICFSKIKFNSLLKKIINFAAPSTFAIYILNVQRYVLKYGIENKFIFLSALKPHMIFIYVITFSFLFVGIGILIDNIRIKLFNIFKIKRISDYIVKAIDNLLIKCSNIL